MLQYFTETSDISNCDVIYYVIYVICSHYVGKAIGPLFAWPSSFGFQYICSFVFYIQLLGECNCWWTKEAPRAHVAKFCGQLRLILERFESIKMFCVKNDRNCNFVGLFNHPFWLKLLSALLDNYFSTFPSTFFG